MPEFVGGRVVFEMAKWAEEYGPIFKLQIGNAPMVVVTDPSVSSSLIRRGTSSDYLHKALAVRAIQLKARND